MELMRQQQPLSRAARLLEAYIEALPQKAKSDRWHPNFGGIVFNVPARKLTVYWKDFRPPKKLLALAEKTGESEGVAIEVRSSRFAKGELEEEAYTLAKQLMYFGDLATGSVSPRSAADGLLVTVRRPLTDVERYVTATSRDQLSAMAYGVDGDAKDYISVEVDPNFRIAPVTGRRETDLSPLTGGARIFIPNIGNPSAGKGCSTAFGFRMTNGTATTYGMATAAHCCDYHSGDSVKTGSENVPLGTCRLLDTCQNLGCRDLAYIDTGSDPVSGRMYIDQVSTGGASLGGATNPLVGLDDDHVGEFVCASGGYSGAQCDIRTSSTGGAAWHGNF